MTPPMGQRRALLADPEVAAVIDANTAATGRPRTVYEDYLLADPRPGQTWEDALHGRMVSLRAGPPSPELIEQVRRMVADSRRRTAA